MSLNGLSMNNIQKSKMAKKKKDKNRSDIYSGSWSIVSIFFGQNSLLLLLLFEI